MKTFTLAILGALGTGLYRRTLLAGLACLALILAAQPAAAQFNGFGGFGRVAKQKFESGGIYVIMPDGKVGRSVGVWSLFTTNMARARTSLIDSMKTELPKRKVAGFGPYFIGLNAPVKADEQLFVGTDGAGFTLRYLVRGYTATIGLHTPDVDVPVIGPVGAPRSANPKFTISVDVELTVDVDTTNGVAVRNAVAKIHAGRPQDANITGSILSAVNDVVNFVGGPDFIAKTQNKINGREINVKGQLQEELNKLFPPGTLPRNLGIKPVFSPRLPAFRGSRDKLRLELYKDTGGPVVR